MPLQKPGILHMIDFRKILKLGFIHVIKIKVYVYVLYLQFSNWNFLYIY